AQGWAPTKSVRLIVPFTPGGTADLLGRLLAQHLTEALGQTVVVDNRGGGGTIIATEALVNAPADGHTLGMIASGYATNVTLVKKLSYNPHTDIQPLSLLGRVSILLVANPTLSARTPAELVALAYNALVPLSYGSPGNGSGGHLAGALFQLKTGAPFVHVPYRGGAPAMNDLQSGQIPLLFNAFTSTLPFVQSGAFRAIAMTGAKRMPVLADTPTLAESGYPGFEMYEWFGMALPAHAPPEIGQRYYAEIIAFLKRPDVAERLTVQGVEVVPQSPAEFRGYIETEIARYRELIESVHITPE
ncbi:MAG: tripartite tricarboxylate transporter substrate binding protein, partial [Alphaproteobacteria bacterium]|nr:tripartite tricarboxylate transporter substrate binding protein [Alphaproteobacteria bacterium]